MELLQVISEFAPVEGLYRTLRPQRVLEIGCWDGGTLQVWLDGCGPDATVVAVDPNHRNADAYKDWIRDDVTLTLIYGLSQTYDVISQIRENGPYDWAFIDGDHGDACVRSDFDVCLPLVRKGGHILLHDITPPAGTNSYPPGELLDELERKGHKVERFEEINRDPWSHGIGLVKV